jgi:UDPglucose 6-dehydrogenase
MGARVKAYDPVAKDAAAKLLPDSVSYGADVYSTIHDADACLILTEWDEVKNMNLAVAKELLRTPVVIDGRNCFGLEQMDDLGFTYYSIGRSVVFSSEMQSKIPVASVV